MKQAFASKVVWLNIITSAIGILMLAAQMSELEPFAPWIVLVVGALNIILRIWFTTEPLTFTPPAELEARRPVMIDHDRRATDRPMGGSKV